MKPLDLESLSDAARDTVVLSGLQFMRSITEAYGATTGLELWDTIADTLGNDLKGAIFFRLMTGDGDCNVVIYKSATRNAGNSGNFIPYIKLVREYTGFGLKEAKDLCDKTELGESVHVSIPFNRKSHFLTELGKLGVSAS